MERIKHLAEALFLTIIFAGLKRLPLDTASFVGGFIARSVGPLLSAHRIAEKNLTMIFPDMSEREKRRILNAMWDNLGRVAAEMSGMASGELQKRVRLHGAEHFPKEGESAFFFSGHLGNWELTYPMAFHHGVPVTLIYREANNPYVDKMIQEIRTTQSTDMLPKGLKGAVKMARAVKKGQSIALLIDQKMNDGIAVPFFGRTAMTAPAIAEYVLRFNMKLIPARVIRRKGVHFDGYVYPPLEIEKTGDHEKDVLAIMTEINRILEGWIREYPEQWFWVHKRWPSV